MQIAKHLNVKASQVHRWSCPICEHDAEPKYSLACALKAYLSNPDLAAARNGKRTHRTIFQAQQAKPRWPVKLMEVIREGSDWQCIPLN